MPSTYSRRSSSGKRDHQLGPWVSGVAYNKAVEDVGETEVASMSNIELDTSGELKKRLGTASYKGTDRLESGDPTVTFCGEFLIPPSDTPEVVVIAGNKAYRHTGSAWADITNSLTISTTDDHTFVGAVDGFKGILYVTNGVDGQIFQKTGAGNFVAADVNSKFTEAETVAFFNNQVWWGNTGTNYNKLFYSDIGDGTAIESSNYFQFDNPIRALVAQRDSLAIHTVGGIFTVTPTGNTQIPFIQEQVAHFGTVSKRGVALLPGDIQLFIRREGIYAWGGEDAEKISGALDGGYWPHINKDRLIHSFALYYPEKDQTWFWLPYGATQTEMNHIMIWSGAHKAFFGPYEGGSVFTRNCAGLIGGKPHAGTHDSSGSIGGTVQDHQPADTYNDDDNSSTGTAIKSYFKTGAPAPEGSANTVRWLYARTYYDALGEVSITVEQESSGVAAAVQTFTGHGLSSTLDSSKLDEMSLGSLRMLSIDTAMTGYDPHSSLRFSNSVVDASFTIRRAHPVYRDIGPVRRRKAGVE